MKISTKGRYALRLMIDIALHDSQGPVRIKDVATRQQISDKYLEQIVSSLNKAGFVKSLRGPQGGYRLTKKPREYTAGMILRLIEGSLAPVSCLDEPVNHCPRYNICATMTLWERMYNAVNEVIDNITLADLVKWQKEKYNENTFSI